MYEYQFVKVDLRRHLFERRPSVDHHEIIDQYSRQGWRLVQIFAPGLWGYGKPTHYELIFEKAK